jgi:hypothetical protein
MKLYGRISRILNNRKCTNDTEYIEQLIHYSLLRFLPCIIWSTYGLGETKGSISANPSRLLTSLLFARPPIKTLASFGEWCIIWTIILFFFQAHRKAWMLLSGVECQDLRVLYHGFSCHTLALK